jgi:hypothetical protein
MNFFFMIRSFLKTLLFAVGQLFAWLNRKEERRETDETQARIRDNMAAAAKPNRENADRLNRWLSRGRSGRLRNPPR